MKKEFVPYKLALRLKNLGFNEPCFGFYQKEYVEDTPFMVDDDNQYRLTGYRTCKNSEIPEHYTSAPTFSQAFRWFREKYKLINIMEYYNEWNYEILRIDENISELQDDLDIDYIYKGGTYEEAEIDCLEKLISIVE